MNDGGPIHPDVLFITESKEFLAGELCAVVCDDGVRYSRAMDDVEEEQHSLLGFDHGDRPSLYPFCELVHDVKQVHVAPGRSFEGFDWITPPDHEQPCDRDRLSAWTGKWV